MKLGKVGVGNASQSALALAQEAFVGAGADFGVEDDDDVQRLVGQVRAGVVAREAVEQRDRDCGTGDHGGEGR